jgi:hypothetical protein
MKLTSNKNLVIKNTTNTKLSQSAGEKRKVEDKIDHCENQPIPINSFNNSNFMQMAIVTTATITPADPTAPSNITVQPANLLPILQSQPPPPAPAPGTIQGLEAVITLADVRLETIKVVYRGLCYLSNKIPKIITKNKNNPYEFIFTKYYTVNFADFFINESKINRDDLSGITMKTADTNVFISISFLEKLISQNINNPPGIQQDIYDVLNSFTISSSGKEYLDVGQLYAIIDPTNSSNRFANTSNLYPSQPTAQNPPEFWTHDLIIARVTQILTLESSDVIQVQELLVRLYPSYQEIQTPKRPFYETYDGAAACIAGRYYNVYTESNIRGASEDIDPRTSRDLKISPGSVPYLFEQKYVLYLCFLVNSIFLPFDDTSSPFNLYWNQTRYPDQYMLLITIKNLLTIQTIPITMTKSILFDLFYNFIYNDFKQSPGGILETYYIAHSSIDQSRKIIDNWIYNLLSSVYYFYNALNNTQYQNNLINLNLDPLCHDNKQCEIYRLLMMYNFVKKNDSKKLLNFLTETFQIRSNPKPQPQFRPKSKSQPQPKPKSQPQPKPKSQPQPKPKSQPNYDYIYVSSPKLESIPDKYLPTTIIKTQTTKEFIKPFVNSLISNFTELQKRIFYKLADYDYVQIQHLLFNNMLSKSCYVFQVNVMNSTTLQLCVKSMLISFAESISLQMHMDTTGFFSYTPLPKPTAAYSLAIKLVPTISIDRISPFDARCVCDLAISSGSTLTNWTGISDTIRNSIFNITPVTFNDAASAATEPMVQYIDSDVTIQFGNNQQYRFIFHGINTTTFTNTYLPSVKGLQYYYSLEKFNNNLSSTNTNYSDIKQKMDNCGDDVSAFYYELLHIYRLKFSFKDELYNASHYFIQQHPLPLNQLLMDSSQYPTSRGLKTIEDMWHDNGNLISQNIKKPLEILVNKLETFRQKYAAGKSNNTVVSAIGQPPIFEILVDNIMDWIDSLDFSTPNNIILNCDLILKIRSFISKIMNPLTVDPAFLPPVSSAEPEDDDDYDDMLIDDDDDGDDDGVAAAEDADAPDSFKRRRIDPVGPNPVAPVAQNSSKRSRLTDPEEPSKDPEEPSNKRSRQVGGNIFSYTSNIKSKSNYQGNGILYNDVIGPYGFYQTINQNGALEIQPINTQQQLKNVWRMYGIDVESTSSQAQDTGKGLEQPFQSQLTERKQQEIDRLIRIGKTEEEAKEMVLKNTRETSGVGSFVPTEQPSKRTGIFTLSDFPPKKQYGDQYGTPVMVTSSTVTKRAGPMGGKLTRKKRQQYNKRRNQLSRKKQKRIIRKSRRRR